MSHLRPKCRGPCAGVPCCATESFHRAPSSLCSTSGRVPGAGHPLGLAGPLQAPGPSDSSILAVVGAVRSCEWLPSEVPPGAAWLTPACLHRCPIHGKCRPQHQRLPVLHLHHKDRLVSSPLQAPGPLGMRGGLAARGGVCVLPGESSMRLACTLGQEPAAGLCVRMGEGLRASVGCSRAFICCQLEFSPCVVCTHTKVLSLNKSGTRGRTYQASQWPVAATYLLGLTCCFLAYLELGTHLGALLPMCLCILGMSSLVDVPLPNKFLCPKSPVS